MLYLISNRKADRPNYHAQVKRPPVLHEDAEELPVPALAKPDISFCAFSEPHFSQVIRALSE
jgi:hypothetical protein